MRRANEDLKKKYENEIGSLKIDNIVKGLFMKQKDDKLENLQQENENLKKVHEKEIILLKSEVMELKEKLNAKTATNETNDNLNFVHDTASNQSDKVLAQNESLKKDIKEVKELFKRQNEEKLEKLRQATRI